MSKDFKELSPEKKMELAQAGDSGSYKALLTELSTIIKGYLYKRMSEAGEVEDVLQEVLISIHKARHTFDTSRELMPWVMAIVKFRLNDYFRKHYGSVLKDAIDLSDIEEKVSENVTFEAENTELINKALALLPEKQQKIVQLMKIEGYTASEVGNKLNMNVSAVKVSAHRAYKILKKELEKLEYEN